MTSMRSFAMTIGLREFRRLLPAALGGIAFEDTGDGFQHADGDRAWRLELSPLPELSLGAVRLERHLVRWTFSGYEEAEIQALVARFERHFQRGGG